LYIKVSDAQCQKRLINAFNIPARGAKISVQDLDLMIAEHPGGKDQLFRAFPWLGVGFPILVCVRLGTRFYGFQDVVKELTEYHEKLDHYHAALQASKIPGVDPYATNPTSLWPQPSAHPTPYAALPRAPTVVGRPPVPTRPASVQPQPALAVKSEQKRQADATLAPPPPQDPRMRAPLPPAPTNWDNIYVKATTTGPTEPLLSQQVKQRDPGVPLDEQETYVDEATGNPISAEQVASGQYIIPTPEVIEPQSFEATPDATEEVGTNVEPDATMYHQPTTVPVMPPQPLRPAPKPITRPVSQPPIRDVRPPPVGRVMPRAPAPRQRKQ
jgi:hypothetical protein